MRKHRVYLDCDQVLSDFVAGALEAVGCPYEGMYKWPEDWTYDFFPFAGTSREEVNKHCTIDFWANLPWTEDGKDILKEVLTRFRPDEVMLLTKPMANDESYTGKVRWVAQQMPELRRRIVPTDIPKHEFAFDWNCLLIDDADENVEDFIRAGGAAILVPRPWNENSHVFSAGETVSYIAGRLDAWMRISDHPARNRKEEYVQG